MPTNCQIPSNCLRTTGEIDEQVKNVTELQVERFDKVSLAVKLTETRNAGRIAK